MFRSHHLLAPLAVALLALGSFRAWAEGDPDPGATFGSFAAPTNVSARAISTAQVVIGWAAPATSGISGYNIYRDGVYVGSTDATVTSYADMGLAPVTQYTYTVTALDMAFPAANESPVSEPSSATTMASAPGYVLQCNDAGASGSLVIDANLLGRDVTMPRCTSMVSVPLANATVTLQRWHPLDLNDPFAVWQGIGLLPAGWYVWTPNGWQTLAQLLGASTPPQVIDTTPPTVPSGLTATAASATSITLAWTASTDTGTGLGGYRVFRNGTQIGTSTTGSYTDAGLNAATTYSYKVSAYDRASPVNVSVQSGLASATTLASTPVDTTPPTVPAGLTATAASSTSVSLTWTASTDVGTGVGGYRVFRNGSQVGTTATNSYVDTGLTASTAYTYKVSAYDLATPPNVSAPSGLVSATTPAASTLDPTLDPNPAGGGEGQMYQCNEAGAAGRLAVDENSLGLSVTMPHCTTMVAVPYSSATLVLQRWHPDSLTDPFAVWQSLAQLPDGWSVWTPDGWLTLAQVQAGGGNSSSGGSSSSDSSSDSSSGGGSGGTDSSGTTPDTTPPRVPTALVATAQGSRSVLVSWEAASDGGAGVAGYVVRRDGVALPSVSGTSVLDTDLAPDTAYSYTVSAYDLANPPNESAESAPFVVTTPATQAEVTLEPDAPVMPVTPTGLLATPLSSSSIQLDWSDASPGGAAKGGYRVYRNGVAVATATVPTFEDSGLTAATAYSYAVSALDDAVPVPNESARSAAVTVSTQSADVGSRTVYQCNDASAAGTLVVDDNTLGLPVTIPKCRNMVVVPLASATLVLQRWHPTDTTDPFAVWQPIELLPNGWSLWAPGGWQTVAQIESGAGPGVQAQSSDVTVTVGAPGPTPFIRPVQLSGSSLGHLAALHYTIAPKAGSVSLPVDVTYSFEALAQRGYIPAGGGTVLNLPVFGLYAGRTNSVHIELRFDDGSSRVLPTLQLDTDPYVDPNATYDHLQVLTPRSTDSVLGYSFFAIRSALGTPVVVDTDGEVRWVGTGVVNSLSSHFDGGGFVVGSQGSPEMWRLELDGSVNTLLLGATDVVNFHHNIDPGKVGLLAEVDTTDGTVTNYEATLLELAPDGSVLKRWDVATLLADYMTSQGDDPSEFIRAGADWLHMNAATYDASDDTLIVSSRENFVIKLDYNTGAPVWILGDPTKYWYTFPSLQAKALTLDDADAYPMGQHAVSVTSDGLLLLFDNGTPSANQPAGAPIGARRAYSKVTAYSIDPVAGTATQAWNFDYGQSIYSAYCSSAYQAPDRSLLIDYAMDHGPSQAHIVGLDADRAVVFDFLYPSPNYCRAAWNSQTVPFEKLQF